MTPVVRGEALRRFLERRVHDGSTPGGAFWVRGLDGRIDEGGGGVLGVDRPDSRPDTDTIYDLASLTKPLVTGLLLALLEAEGALDLEAPVGEKLPELRGSNWGEASSSELARHRSGLPAWKPLYLAGQGPESYLAQIAAEQPSCPRGATLYSDLGYILLGLVIERAAGLGLADSFAGRVAVPLGLRRTGFPAAGRSWAEAAPTERGNGFERELAGLPPGASGFRNRIPPGEVHDGNAWGLSGVAGHAGLFSSAGEVGKLALAILGEGTLLSPRARELLLSVDSSGRSIGFVAAGQSRAARGILPDPAPGHTGFTGTSLWIDPGPGRVFVLLTNRVHPRVSAREFGWVRRGFHRLAAGAAT